MHAGADRAVQRIVVTGAGRGIGLEVARQYVERGDRVLAGCRDIKRAPSLRQLVEQHRGLVSVLSLDVGANDSIAMAVRQAHAEISGVDVLINNAAINPGDAWVSGPDGQSLIDAGRMLEVLRVNAVAPLVVAQAFKALLRAGTNPRIVNISSDAGSLTYKAVRGDYNYAASKAALNMLTRALAFDVQGDGIITVMIHPGWVRTEMGGPDAELEPRQSARGLIAVIDGLAPRDAGRFLRYDGFEMPW